MVWLQSRSRVVAEVSRPVSGRSSSNHSRKVVEVYRLRLSKVPAGPPSTWRHRSISEPATRHSARSPFATLVRPSGWVGSYGVVFIRSIQAPFGQ